MDGEARADGRVATGRRRSEGVACGHAWLLDSADAPDGNGPLASVASPPRQASKGHRVSIYAWADLEIAELGGPR